MAKYTIYHPLPSEILPVNPTNSGVNIYCTDLMIYELRKELNMLGHSTDIAYFPINSLDGKRLCIEELGIDVTYFYPIAK